MAEEEKDNEMGRPALQNETRTNMETELEQMRDELSQKSESLNRKGAALIAQQKQLEEASHRIEAREKKFQEYVNTETAKLEQQAQQLQQVSQAKQEALNQQSSMLEQQAQEVQLEKNRAGFIPYNRGDNIKKRKIVLPPIGQPNQSNSSGKTIAEPSSGKPFAEPSADTSANELNVKPFGDPKIWEINEQSEDEYLFDLDGEDSNSSKPQKTDSMAAS